MATKRSFELVYDEEIIEHLASIERKYHSLLRQMIEERLKYEPMVETRNRKPLDRSSKFGVDTWEIRFGSNNRFRVFYRFDLSRKEVRILAIGVKVKNQLFVGGERFEL